MESRKIIGFGKSSFVVSLPKEWVEKNGLCKGKEVFIADLQTELRIKSNNNNSIKKESKVRIDTNKQSLPAIKREICSNYINNTKHIELYGSGVADYGDEIKKYMREFMVFEIIEETDDLIVAKDYLNLYNMEKEKIIERMVSILKSMFGDLRKNITQEIYQSLKNRDSQVDKYHFLMERFAHHHLSNNNSNENYVKILYYVQASTLLEGIGDYIKQLSFHVLSKKLEFGKKHEAVLEKCENYFSENMTAFLNEDRNRFIKATQDYRDFLHDEISNFSIPETDKDSLIALVRNIHKSARSVIGFNKPL